MNTQNHEEEILTRRAKLTRERLLAVVDELDRKRHAISHPMKLVSENAPEPATLAAISAAAMITVGTIGYVIAKRNRRRRQQQVRFFARTPPPPSFWSDIFSRTAKALITFGLVQAGKVALKNVPRLVAEQKKKPPETLRLPGASSLRGVGDLNP